MKTLPRGTDTFGSLAVVYPTPHEGGELVLRHKGHEWKFDAKALTASQSSPSLACVAFCSDIEYEVLKVTAGRRITVTFNLYLVDPLSRRYDYYNDNYEGALVKGLGGASVKKTEYVDPNSSRWVSEGVDEAEFTTCCVSPFNGRNQLQDTTVAYWNEPSVGLIYCSPCIIARIAPASDRA